MLWGLFMQKMRRDDMKRWHEAPVQSRAVKLAARHMPVLTILWLRYIVEVNTHSKTEIKLWLKATQQMVIVAKCRGQVCPKRILQRTVWHHMLSMDKHPVRHKQAHFTHHTRIYYADYTRWNKLQSTGRVLQTNNDVVRKFYAAANAICSHVKFASEISVLFLMETFCLPILSYSCEAVCYNKQQLSQLNTCNLS